MSSTPGTARLGWSPDVLEGYESAPLGTTTTGQATLVRPTKQPERPALAVLHVHGYNDYFFQTHLAEAICANGHAFYAVDTRRAGRSLRPGDVPHVVADVRELGDDIGAAVDAIAALHPSAGVVVHAHSMGGLAAAIWASERPSPSLVGLALDAPFFRRHSTRVERAGTPLLPLLARARPMMRVSTRPSVYAHHQHVAGGGRWDFDTRWKNPQGVPARAVWAEAVRQAQRTVANGLDIPVPVLVAHSAISGPESEDNPLLDSQDVVIDVEAVARLAPGLGTDVTCLAIDGAVHDLTLSATEPRNAYVGALLKWLDRLTA